MSADLAVDARDLVKVFPKGNVRALDGVSLEVPAGRSASGCSGRTVRARRPWCGSSRPSSTPDEGRARSSATTSRRQAEPVRRRIGLAGQYATVDENLTGSRICAMIGRLCRRLSRGEAARGRRAPGAVRARPTPATVRSRPTRAACGAASTSPRRWWPGPRCSSWTSRRPASTPRAARTSRCHRGASSTAGTTILLTTQYLEEADRLVRRHRRGRPRPDHRRGHPGRPQGRPGRDRDRARPSSDEARVARRAAAAGPPSDHPLFVDGGRLELTVDHGPAGPPRRCAASTARASRCAGIVAARAEPRRRRSSASRAGATEHRRRRRLEPASRKQEGHDDRDRSSPGETERRDRRRLGLRGGRSPTPRTIAWRNLVAITRIPEAPVLLDPAADHVRAALPLRVRRRDRHPSTASPTSTT